MLVYRNYDVDLLKAKRFELSFTALYLVAIHLILKSLIDNFRILLSM